VLVPLLPVSNSVLAIGILLILAGVGLGVYTGLFDPKKITGTACATVALAALTLVQHSPCEAETAYHCVRIEVSPERPTADVLILDRDYNSEEDLADPRYLGFNYTQWIGAAIDAMGRPRTPLDAVVVGGGGFTLPRWLWAIGWLSTAAMAVAVVTMFATWGG